MYACTPADDAGSPADPETHLVCKKLRGISAPRRTLELSDRFGSATATLTRPTHYSVPGEESGMRGAGGVDELACYKLRGGHKVDQILTLTDRYGTRATRVKRAKLACLPASRNGDPLVDPARAVTCYSASDVDAGPAQTLTLESPLGTETIEVKKPKLLCVGSGSAPCAMLTVANAGGGSEFCGPPAAPPLGGATYDAAIGGSVVDDLGLGCSYAGGGQADFSGSSLDGLFTTTLQTRACTGGTLQLDASSVAGIEGCQPSTSGSCAFDFGQECTSDADCFNVVGACIPRPRCWLAAPAPVRDTNDSFCALTPIVGAPTAVVDPATGAVSLAATVRTMLHSVDFDYVAHPCPRCIAGTCDRGDRMGLPCTVESSELGTSNDCPPSENDLMTFNGLPATPLVLTTSSQTLTADGSGFFCAGQANAGAFGNPAARRITVAGAAAGSLQDGLPHAATLGGLMCYADTPAEANWDLPGPVATGMPVQVQLTQ